MGSPGRSVLAGTLSFLRAQWKTPGVDGFDFVVVNCENAAAGKGMTGKIIG